MPAAKETYGYSEQFQTAVASFTLRDPIFLRDYGDVVDPTYFDYETLTSIVRIGRDLFERNNDIPSKPLIQEEIKLYCKSFHLPADDVSDIVAKLDEIYSTNLTDANAIKERMTKFGRRQAVRSSLIQIADLVDSDDDFDKGIELLEAALRVGTNANELGISLFKQLKDLPRMARREERGYVHKIRTGFPIFDQKTLGGVGRGEHWVILGLTGAGKSQFLVNIGVAALEQKMPTIHITVGDLDEEDVAIRYLARLTRCKQLEVVKEEANYLRRLDKLCVDPGAYLRIKYFDPGTTTVAHVKNYMSRVHSVEGIKPAMLILDYPDEFKKSKTLNDYENMGEIYNQIKVVLRQYNCAGWSASQVHRWTPRHKSDVLSRNNIADSAKKTFKCDGLCSINQTWEESEQGHARLWVDKVRRGQQFFLVPLDVDYSSSLVKQGSLMSDDDSK